MEKCPTTTFSKPPTFPGKAGNEGQDLASGSSAALAINPLKYLDYLLTQAKSFGAKTLTANLLDLHTFVADMPRLVPSIDGQPPRLAVNCTGLSAQHFCNDKAMYPIRGQTLLARITPTPKQEVLIWQGDGEVTYVVPRVSTDAFVLGGTVTDDEYDATPTPDISEGIMQRCRKLLGPVQFEVLKEQVGLRPGRRGGHRVEREEVGGGYVVHNYGHAGDGFQSSIGAARKVVGLVEQSLDQTS